MGSPDDAQTARQVFTGEPLNDRANDEKGRLARAISHRRASAFHPVDGTRPPDNETQVIYFVQTGKLVKIGSSRSFAEHYAALRAANASELRVLGIIEDGAKEEVHRRFAALRVHDEWFKADDELLTYVQKHARCPSVLVTNRAQRQLDKLLDGTGPRPLMTIKELAAHWQTSVPTIRREIKRRNLTGIRIGRQIRFDTKSLAGHFREVAVQLDAKTCRTPRITTGFQMQPDATSQV